MLLFSLGYKVSAQALYEAGERCLAGKGIEEDCTQAIQYYYKAAFKGHLEAQYRLGFLRHYGWGMRQDYKLASGWYSRPAEAGHMHAQYNLGRLYHTGQGVDKRSYTKAFYWYSKAALQGSADAKYRLGTLYEHGSGVEKNIEIAAKYYWQANEHKHALAEEALRSLLKRKLMKIEDLMFPKEEALSALMRAIELRELEETENLGCKIRMK